MMNPAPVLQRFVACIATVEGDECGKPATHTVTFGDGERAAVCQPCAVRLELLASSHGTHLKAERR